MLCSSQCWSCANTVSVMCADVYLMISPCLPIFFVIFLLMTRHYLFLIPILKIWKKKTNIEINSVFNWLQKNKLTLNLSKAKAILFNNHNRPVTLNINCNNVPLEQVNSTIYLGTTVDSNLTWKKQIDSVERK